MIGEAAEWSGRLAMDPTNPHMGDFDRERVLRELDRTIQYARLRCLPASEIIDRISNVCEEDDLGDHIARLSEMQLAQADLDYLVVSMKRLAGRAEESSSRLKLRIDRVLTRLVRLLPSELAVYFAEPYVNHRRKTRRQWAYKALREKQISGAIAVKLSQSFQETGDQDALQLIARNPTYVPNIGADFLLKNLKERYWRARVVEALIVYDRPAALSLSQEYPFEFAHAVGRNGDKTLLGPLSALFEGNSEDAEFLSIYAYALGKLGGKSELESLELFIREKWGPFPR